MTSHVIFQIIDILLFLSLCTADTFDLYSNKHPGGLFSKMSRKGEVIGQRPLTEGQYLFKNLDIFNLIFSY